MGNLFFIGDVAQIGAGVTASGLAGSHGFVQLFGIEVDQGDARALAGEVFAHGTAQALAATGDDDDLVFQLHRNTPTNSFW